MIPLLVEYINAVHSCLNTTTFFSLSHPPFARSSHIRQVSVDTAFVGHNNNSDTTQIHTQEYTGSAQRPAALELLGQQFKKRGDNCKRATVLKRRDGDVLALACRGVSVALSARYKSGLEARREQHELILLHPHPTVPSYAATNPLTHSISNLYSIQENTF
jgi:hypothetical protein